MSVKVNRRFGILVLALALTLVSVAILLNGSSQESSFCVDQSLTGTDYVLVPEITNAAHMHPWLATTISILFLGFIVFVIILCGDKAG
jgi:hypothetical protein